MDALKAVEQSVAQWPGVEVMVDFCQTGDSPCPQLEIKAKRRANTLLGSMFLIQAGSKCSSCLMIDSWLLAPSCNQTISDGILGGCIFWHVTCSLGARLGPLAWPIVEVPRWPHGSTGHTTRREGVICFGSSPASSERIFAFRDTWDMRARGGRNVEFLRVG